MIGQNGISVLNDDGTFYIPHMDTAMADRIMAVNKNVQTAIKQKKAEKENHFFLQDQDWNANTLEEFRNKITPSLRVSGLDTGGTYLSSLFYMYL